MEVPKKLTFTIVLLVAGFVFLLLGIIGQFEYGQLRLDPISAWLRIVLSLAGTILMIAAIVLEIRRGAYRRIIGNAANIRSNSLRAGCAAEFFFTLDDSKAGNFSELARGAKRVSILGRTIVNLLGQYGKAFERLAREGCQIRLLFVDPQCDSSKFLYGGSSDVYAANVKTTSSHLARLKKAMGPSLQIRTMKHAPTMSIILVDRAEDQQSFARVQLYFIHSCIGRDRPLFLIGKGQKWYNEFCGEFTELWDQGVDHPEPEKTLAILN